MRSAGVDSIDTILDAGAEGLRYFEVFFPRYREWTGHDPAGGGYHALAAMYDQQRGTDLETLGRIALALDEELQGRLGDQVLTQTTRFSEVSNHWTGSSAAANAQQFLADTAARINTSADALRAVHTAATTAISQIDTAVRTKADTLKGDLTPDSAASKTPQQIDWIIDLARGKGDTSQSVHERLQTELADHYVDDTDPKAMCRNWLDQVFVAEIDAKVTQFTTLCSDTHTTVTAAYEQLLTALDSVQPTAFISPGGMPAADTDLAYATGQPSYLVGSPQSTTPPEGENPPVVQDPGQTPKEEPVAADDDSTTPSSLALTTPAVTNISGDTSTEDESSGDTSTGDESGEDTSTGDESGEDTSTGDESSGGTSTAPASELSAWTPADIANMVTAVSQITGTIPDMVTAVSDLASSIDGIITATGDATAAIIDAADNQPSAPPVEDTEITEEDEEVEDTTDVDQEEDETSTDDSEENYPGDQEDSAQQTEDTETEDTETEDTQTSAVEVGAGDTDTDTQASSSPGVAAGAGAALNTSYGSLRGILATQPSPRSTSDRAVPPAVGATAQASEN
ncbi:hypothetical protein NLM24_04725 [Nocardia zapadnayensis]|nr:hypothetical protein [Nocardia zapadnayensis]MCX0270023.1 hypothetical protein [Nocardia zapadnayensis]